MQQQYPSAFQFSEYYLVAVWDTLCLGMFDSFIFGDVLEREQYARKYALMSPWDWSRQFAREDQALFQNPLYKARTELDLDIPQSYENDKRTTGSLARKYSLKLSKLHESIPSQHVEVLRPVTVAPMIKLWKYMYMRWLGPLQIIGGGSPSEYVQQCVLVEEIIHLQHRIESLQQESSPSARPGSDLLFSVSNSLSPSASLTSSFPYKADGATAASQMEILISSFLENSTVICDKELEQMSLED